MKQQQKRKNDNADTEHVLILCKRDGGTVGQAFLSDDLPDEVSDDEGQYEPPVKKTSSRGHDEFVSESENEFQTFKDMYESECRRRDKEEKLLLDKLASKNSQIEKLKKRLKQQSQHIPSKSMTDREGESKGDGGIVGQALLTDDATDGVISDDGIQDEQPVSVKKTSNRGHDELGSESENEEYANAEEMNQGECRHHDEQETLPNAELEGQYSRTNQLEESEKQQSHHMPSKYATHQEGELEDTGDFHETGRLEWNVETLADIAISFDYPCGVAFSDTYHLAVCNRDNHRVDVIDMVTKHVSYLKFEGRFGKPLRPQDVAISADNLLFISDRGNGQIVVSDEDGEVVRTFGNEEKHFEPFGIALMGSDAVVSDTAEHRILKYTTDGQYVCEVGGYGKSYGQFDEPYSVAVNSLNQVLATDFHNHRVQVFNSDLEFLYSVGKSGSSPGQLQNPYGINVDSDDNMYVCDFDNHRVAKFTKKGKFDCNLFESDVNYPMYVAVSKVTADQFRIAVSQWQANEIKIYFQS
ncbi:uncharacterized protein [Ptychodera flava]|uniref:uncharacterized protein n=1 Tax=Ptychodera flava TaxID=63121 RepID=UPI00396A860C